MGMSSASPIRSSFFLSQAFPSTLFVMSIPKKIHFCWLSGDPYPRKIRRCMATWQKLMPDYELCLWDTQRFPMETAPAYVQEAFACRKWAFAADYIRMYALYTEGGIYLDSDVLLLKNLEELLDHDFTSSMEFHPIQIEKDGAMAHLDETGHRTDDAYISGIQIQAAVMAARPGCAFVKEVLDWYADKHFLRPDGSMDTQLLSPQIYARIAEPRGFIYKDIDQHLQGDVMIYRSEIFAGNKHEVTPDSYAIHYCAHSWHPNWKEKLRKFFGLK